MARRRGNPDVDGVLVVDKPGGMSSYDVIRRLKPVLGTARLGHTGTLDPMATGVLVVCAGWSTRLVPYLSDDWKEYTGAIRLGVRTDTDDAEGTILEEREVTVDDAAVLEAAGHLVGPIEQVPPAYSAIRVDGQRAYSVARKGGEVALDARPVEVARFDLERAGDSVFRFTARVSKGTYIRSLARDLGDALGCGGHLTELRRTRNEPFGIDEAVPLARVAGPDDLLRPFDALRSLPSVRVSDETAAELRQGKTTAFADAASLLAGDDGSEDEASPVLVRVDSDGAPGDLIGLVRPLAHGWLKPVRIRPERVSD